MVGSGEVTSLLADVDATGAFSVYGPAPSSVDASAQRLAQFFAVVAKP